MRRVGRAVCVVSSVVAVGLGGMASGCLKGPAPGAAPGTAPGAGPGQAPGTSPAAPAGPDIRIEPLRTVMVVVMDDMAFKPARLTIPKGSAVRFVNREALAHNAVSDDHDTWGTPLLRQGESAEITFDKAGTHPYHCDPHPWMTGTIEVE